MAHDLTDDERDFLARSDGGLEGALGYGTTAAEEAREAMGQLLDRVRQLYPSRTERLAVLGAMAKGALLARDQLLDDVLEGRYGWVELGEDDWRSVAWQGWETQRLADLTGLGVKAIRERQKRAAADTLERAKLARTVPAEPAMEPCAEDEPVEGDPG